MEPRAAAGPVGVCARASSLVFDWGKENESLGHMQKCDVFVGEASNRNKSLDGADYWSLRRAILKGGKNYEPRLVQRPIDIYRTNTTAVRAQDIG